MLLFLRQVVEDVEDASLALDVEGGNGLHHPGCAAGLGDVESDQGSGVAAEHDLIGGVGLFAHRNAHQGWIVGCGTPIVGLVAIVVDCLEGHLGREFGALGGRCLILVA